MEDLAPWADAIITVTGRPGILGADHFTNLRDGVVLGNVGHFPFEIDVPALQGLATSATQVTDSIDVFQLETGKSIALITGGRMFNLAGAMPKGNSIESMDVGFMLQAVSLERVATRANSLVPGPQPVPDDINRLIARRTLEILAASE